MQNKQGSPLRYALDDWPPLSRTVLLGIQWAAIVIPSIIILGHVIASLEFAEPVSQTPYLQKLFIVTAVTLVIQVLWGHRLPLIAGPATVLLIGVTGPRLCVSRLPFSLLRFLDSCFRFVIE